MINIQTHPPQSSVTTVTIDLAELPQLSFVRRVVLALSLVLITSVEPRRRNERAGRAERSELRQLARLRRDEFVRTERERLAERLVLGSHAWR